MEKLQIVINVDDGGVNVDIDCQSNNVPSAMENYMEAVLSLVGESYIEFLKKIGMYFGYDADNLLHGINRDLVEKELNRYMPILTESSFERAKKEIVKETQLGDILDKMGVLDEIIDGIKVIK